jgi:hypothetical protein
MTLIPLGEYADSEIHYRIERRLKMANLYQIPPFLLIRASGLLLNGRIHFPKNKLGECVHEDEEFTIFRQVIVDPAGNQPDSPGAIFKVCFHFARYSANTNRMLSLIPIPFIVAQPGFRSKTWLVGQKTGIFQGFYEWDTVMDAENYWTSFPLNLMKKRAAPSSLTYSISEVSNLDKRREGLPLGKTVIL